MDFKKKGKQEEPAGNMWEDKRVRQMNMWERIFLKVRYNKQTEKKKMLVFYYHRERNCKHTQEHDCVSLLVQAKTQDPACPVSPAAAVPGTRRRQTASAAHSLRSPPCGSFSGLSYGMGVNLIQRSDMKASNTKTSGDVMNLN